MKWNIQYKSMGNCKSVVPNEWPEHIVKVDAETLDEAKRKFHKPEGPWMYFDIWPDINN